MIINRINNTSTMAAPLFPVLHIINHPPFYLFTLFYGKWIIMCVLMCKIFGKCCILFKNLLLFICMKYGIRMKGSEKK